ncbi:MAG: phosphoglucomutase [Chloracidobacterium sp. CP2_5A]|nr:MAG: phosphoglucomutase [Chloracidobacterium sp. CP2_5A]
MSMIAFGTSGWRAILADEFTFANVRLVTHSIADELQNAGAGGLLVIGYDPRFMAEKFVAVCAEELSLRGFDTLITARDTPTPTLSVAIRARGARGGINFTASHNPPEYGGMKFSTANGAPALPEVTKRVETFIRRRLSESTLAMPVAPPGAILTEDLQEMYLSVLAEKVDGDTLHQRPLRIAYDALWGTGRGYLDTFLRAYGCEVTALHDWRDPYFGGRSPEPSEANLAELKEVVTRGGYDLGLATDGDGDRFGVIDRDGSFIPANAILALLVDYLHESRGWREGVGRSVATSHWLDRVASRHGIPVHETPVGFKFLGELILEEKIFLGGEESAGLSIKGHIPEKDGLLACALVAEMVARRGQSVGEMLAKLADDVGRLVNRRIGVRLTPEGQLKLRHALEEAPPEAFGGKRVTRVDRADGVKFFLEDESWVLIRLSGTEPLARCYAEARTEAEVEVLLESGANFIHQ